METLFVTYEVYVHLGKSLSSGDSVGSEYVPQAWKASKKEL